MSKLVSNLVMLVLIIWPVCVLAINPAAIYAEYKCNEKEKAEWERCLKDIAEEEAKGNHVFDIDFLFDCESGNTLFMFSSSPPTIEENIETLKRKINSLTNRIETLEAKP